MQYKFLFIEEDIDDHKPITTINMIPLIDVMLVLLVLFIITAPLFMPSQLQINVPQVTTTPMSVSEPIALSLDKTGQLFWQGIPISYAKLMPYLNEVKRRATSPTIQLQADKTVPYQQVMEVLAIVEAADITQIAFITESF